VTVAGQRLRSAETPGDVLAVTPRSAGWRVLDATIVALGAGQRREELTRGREIAIVPLTGTTEIVVDDTTYTLHRDGGVFEAMGSLLYVPPGCHVELVADGDSEVAIGGARADGRLPARLFASAEAAVEVRGGGRARRQVNHLLAHPLPAERLIVYEVYVPRGGWSGWPPHCHDGYAGSPYLEETYYFRFDPSDGFGMHRNYRVEEDLDEVFAVADRDLVTVPCGFHTSAAAPGSHMYFLNFLAGDLVGEERAIPPFFQPEYRWIDGRWDVDDMTLPAVTAGEGSHA
jgi:5-deoxy-glucuronate isomerase